MKHAQKYFFNAAVKSFIFGAVTCLCFYTIIRLIFWDFQFSITEEFGNLLKIVCGGGSMFTAAALLFLLIERAVIHFTMAKIPVQQNEFPASSPSHN